MPPLLGTNCFLGHSDKHLEDSWEGSALVDVGICRRQPKKFRDNEGAARRSARKKGVLKGGDILPM